MAASIKSMGLGMVGLYRLLVWNFLVGMLSSFRSLMSSLSLSARPIPAPIGIGVLCQTMVPIRPAWIVEDDASRIRMEALGAF